MVMIICINIKKTHFAYSHVIVYLLTYIYKD